MPRRPSKTKGLTKSKARPVKRADSKIKKWDKISDIPMDEEDQCMLHLPFIFLALNSCIQVHVSRDKILLEGDDSGGEDDGDEDEVFGLKGLSEDSEDEETSQDAEDEDEEEMAMEEPTPKKKKTKGRKAATKEPEPSESGSEEEEVWGRSKSAYYSSNAADLESDDEEANELEEQEAKRLQAKVRDAMGEDDFGLGDPVEHAAGHTEVECVSVSVF